MASYKETKSILDGYRKELISISSIGDRIRDLRLSRGMTREQLGAIMGMGADAVELMEESTVPDLGADEIRHLSETFHAYPRTFLYGSDEEFFTKAFDLGSGSIDIVGSFLATPIASRLLGTDVGAGAFEALMGITRLNAEGIDRAVSLIDELGKVAAYRKEARPPAT